MSPMDRSKYPDNWEEISYYVRFERAKGKCEVCGAEHGKPHPITGSKVVLTTAHLNHDTTDNRMENLKAMCQRCHLRYDAKEHAQHAAETRYRRIAEAGQLSLFQGGSDAQAIQVGGPRSHRSLAGRMRSRVP